MRPLDDVLPQLLEILEPAEDRSPDSRIAHSELTVGHAGLGLKNRIEAIVAGGDKRMRRRAEINFLLRYYVIFFRAFVDRLEMRKM